MAANTEKPAASPNPKTHKPNGEFAKGNHCGPGNPHFKALSAWRAMVAKTVTAADIQGVLKTLLREAKGGKPWAIKELLDRCLGKPAQALDVTTGGEKLNQRPGWEALSPDTRKAVLDELGGPEE